MKITLLFALVMTISFGAQARVIQCNTRSTMLGFPIKVKVDVAKKTYEIGRGDIGPIFHLTEAKFPNIQDILNCGLYDPCIPTLLGTEDPKVTGLASVIQEVNAYQVDPELPKPPRSINMDSVVTIRGYLMSEAQVMGTVGLYELLDSKNKVIATYYHAIELMMCR